MKGGLKMTNNNICSNCNVPELIERTCDKSTQELLVLCSIPSLFTKELIEFYMDIKGFYNIDNIVESFLSQPFVIKRKFKDKIGIVETFSIHDTLKKNILSLSPSTTIVKYANTLIDYYRYASNYGAGKLKEFYLKDKFFCELITGNLYAWQKDVQVAIENNSIEEYKKLVSICKNTFMLSNEYMLQNRLWLDYYILLYEYYDRASCDSLESKIKTLFNNIQGKSFEDNLLKVFLFDLLGMVYFNNNNLEQSYNTLKKALNLCRKTNINNANIYGPLYLNIIIICLKLKNFRRAKRYVILIQTNINMFEQELMINAYKVLGLYKRQIFDFKGALNDYYKAKNLLIKKQKSIKWSKNSDKKIEIKPIYYIDEHSVYDSIGEIFAHQGNHKKAIELYQHALKSQILLQNHSGIAWTKYNIGRLEYLSGNLESSFSFFNQSLHEFHKINQEYNCAYIYGELSYVYQYLGDTHRSISSLEKSINVFLKHKMFPQAILYFNHLGRLYQSQGFIEISNEIFSVCMNYLSKPGNTENIGWLYNNLARNYMYAKQYNEAKMFFDKAKKAFQKSQNLRGLIYVINNIGELYIKLNRFDEAQSLLKISLKYKRNMGDQHAICYTLRELGELYLKKKKFKAAKKCLDESFEICEKYGFKMLSGEIYLSFAKLYGMLQDESKETMYYTKAIDAYKSQNFISRLINCFNLQLFSKSCQNNSKLYFIKKLEILLAQIEYVKHNQKLHKQLEDIFEKIEKEIR